MKAIKTTIAAAGVVLLTAVAGCADSDPSESGTVTVTPSRTSASSSATSEEGPKAYTPAASVSSGRAGTPRGHRQDPASPAASMSPDQVALAGLTVSNNADGRLDTSLNDALRRGGAWYAPSYLSQALTEPSGQQVWWRRMVRAQGYLTAQCVRAPMENEARTEASTQIGVECTRKVHGATQPETPVVLYLATLTRDAGIWRISGLQIVDEYAAEATSPAPAPKGGS